MIHRNPSIKYHPSYWFSALGAGGTAVSFFMYLMWMVPHKSTPIPTFADWSAQLNQGGFLAFSLLLGIIVLSHGVSAIMKHGIAEPASPSLWMMVPILTLIGITWVRLSHGLAHHFGVESSAGSLFLPLTMIVMLQLGVFVLGYKVMKANYYLASYLHGDKASPISFGLVCPGVALFVMGMFWWHIGWVKTGIIDPFGLAYWVGIALLFGIQVVTITALFKLLRKLLRLPFTGIQTT